MSASARRDIHTTMSTVAAAAGDMHASKKIISPDRTPQPNMHRAFSIHLQTTANTGKYRDKPGANIRTEVTVEINMAWRMNPDGEEESYLVALDDEEAIINALMTDFTDPLDKVRMRYIDSSQIFQEPYEWLFSTTRMGVEFDQSLA